MPEHKYSAFVAHSFSSKDDPIWIKIVEQLNGLKTSTGWFDWIDGKPAEGREVENKVRDRIEENPLFIGIFTRNRIQFEFNNSSLHFGRLWNPTTTSSTRIPPWVSNRRPDSRPCISPATILS